MASFDFNCASVGLGGRRRLYAGAHGHPQDGHRPVRSRTDAAARCAEDFRPVSTELFMLNSIGNLNAVHVAVVDGDLGPVEDVLFDDLSWAIRYLVVDAGAWLNERDVLISPYSIKQPVARDGPIEVALTRRLVRSSPDIDTHRPISRGQERELLGHYHYPEYWSGGGLWALRAMPYPLVIPVASADHHARRAVAPSAFHAGDMALRSAEQVAHYEVQATGESIGHVEDFVFDDESWLIRYLVVDTRGWWPAGRKVLIGLHWLDRVDWAQQRIHVTLTREQLRSSPAYEDVGAIHRDYETRLHANYQRPGYWA
jgi:PRC-barrel domain